MRKGSTAPPETRERLSRSHSAYAATEKGRAALLRASQAAAALRGPTCPPSQRNHYTKLRRAGISREEAVAECIRLEAAHD